MTTVLDGGLATELEARGHDLSDRLWSARLLLSEPDAIEEVHLAYFRAGARVAITASYQASVEGFAAAGLDRATALEAIRRSVELAQRARAVPRRRGGSGARPGPGARRGIGGAVRRDARGRLRVSRRLRPRRRGTARRSTGRGSMTCRGRRRPARRRDDPDRPRGARPRPAARRDRCPGLDLVHRPGWRTTAAGEPFAEAIAVAGSGRDVVAVGVNCTAPQHMRALLKIARASHRPPARCLPEPGRHVGSGSRAPGAATGPGRGNRRRGLVDGPRGRGSAAVAAPDRPTSSDWPQRWQRSREARSAAG